MPLVNTSGIFVCLNLPGNALPFGEGGRAKRGRERFCDACSPLPSCLRHATFPNGEGFGCGVKQLDKLEFVWLLLTVVSFITRYIYDVCYKQLNVWPTCTCVKLEHFPICKFAVIFIVDNHIALLEKRKKLFQRNVRPAIHTMIYTPNRDKRF